MTKTNTETHRYCPYCNTTKEIAEFYFNNKNNKYRSGCKTCLSLKGKEYKTANKEKKKASDKTYRERHKKERRIQNKNYRTKIESTFQYKVHRSIRAALRYSLTSGRRKYHSQKRRFSYKDHLPYTIEQLKEHLEKQFEPWMNWDNWGLLETGKRTWQIDHIIPQCILKFDSIEHPNFLKCWSLDNLRPIESADNLNRFYQTSSIPLPL